MSSSETAKSPEERAAAEPEKQPDAPESADQPAGEVGGPKGPEPTRYGDWAFNGRVSDF